MAILWQWGLINFARKMGFNDVNVNIMGDVKSTSTVWVNQQTISLVI